MLRPLTLRQVYGLNPLLPPQDLTCDGDEQDSFVYTSGNLTIIQKGGEQIILHGHTNDVSAFDVAHDKSLIVTGEQSSIIVWDVCTLSPVIVFDSEPYTPISLVFNPSGTGLASLDSDGEIRFYELKNDKVGNSCSARLTDKHALRKTSTHTKLVYSTENNDHLISFGCSSILPLKVNLEAGKISPCGHGTSLVDHEINGSICDTRFLIQSEVMTECASSMSNGSVVIWKGESLDKLTYNRTIKLAPEHEHLTAIRIISESTLAIGSSSRKIRFYDFNFKLKNAINSKHIIPGIHGNITSISLKYQPKYDPESKHGQPLGQPKLPKFAETTLDGKTFQTKSLLITTTHGEIIRIQYDGTTDIKNKSSVFQHGKSSDKITAFQPHTSQNVIALGLLSSATGMPALELFDYEKQARVIRKNCDQWFKDGECVSAVGFDEQGVFLAVGTNQGRLFIFDALTLDMKFEFLLSTRRSGQVENIVFQDTFFAVSDSTFSITLFKIDFGGHGDGGKSQPVQFQYLGRSRSHTSKIVSMSFKGDTLITVGFDRYMVEYDLNSTEYKGEQSLLNPVRQPCRLEQTARPLGSVLHPSIPSKSNEEFLLTITDQQKLRLFNMKTRLARRTTLAPLCGYKIDSIDIVRQSNLLAFSAGTKIGLIQLPADGNPWRQTAILAHPSGVDRIAVSHCGKYLFSLAKNTDKHGCLQCWEVSQSALAAQLELCPKGIEPFIALMDHGRTGGKFNSLKTFFYYASLLSQGIQTSATRRIQDSLPLSYLPDILRACGYYPSEKEVEEMSNEVMFWKYGMGETDELQAEITLADVVKLYVNYQHVTENGELVDQEQELVDAIDQLEVRSTADLLDIVQQRAEALSEEEIASRLACLASNQPPGVEQEWPKNYSSKEFPSLGKVLPRNTDDLVELVFKNMQSQTSTAATQSPK